MPQVSRHCNKGISRNRERGWWQGSEVTRQRSPNSQGAGTEQWPKYKTDIWVFGELSQRWARFISVHKPPNPCLHVHPHFKNMPVFLLLHPLLVPEPTQCMRSRKETWCSSGLAESIHEHGNKPQTRREDQQSNQQGFGALFQKRQSSVSWDDAT